MRFYANAFGPFVHPEKSEDRFRISHGKNVIRLMAEAPYIESQVVVLNIFIGGNQIVSQ